jgi:hypothetical protein
MSRQFIIDTVVGKRKKYTLAARKLGSNWVIADADAREFIEKHRNPVKEWYTPNDIAQAIEMTDSFTISVRVHLPLCAGMPFRTNSNFLS